MAGENRDLVGNFHLDDNNTPTDAAHCSVIMPANQCVAKGTTPEPPTGVTRFGGIHGKALSGPLGGRGI